MPYGFFYNVPNSILIFIFIIVLVSIALIGLYFSTILISRGFFKALDDVNTGLYISAVTIALSIIIAFVITNEWLTFTSVQANLINEANTLYLLYQNVAALPDTLLTQEIVILYICSIINYEFPLMRLGELPEENVALLLLQAALLAYAPQPPLNSQQLIVYQNVIDLFNQALNYRNLRLDASIHGIPAELWWVIIIGFFLVMIMSWLITGDMWFRILMNVFIIVIYAALLFLVVALDYPFRGSFSLTPEPFELVLTRIPAVCP